MNSVKHLYDGLKILFYQKLTQNWWYGYLTVSIHYESETSYEFTQKTAFLKPELSNHHNFLLIRLIINDDTDDTLGDA